MTAAVGMWRINYHELYEGGMNDCFAGNTIGSYGQDTFLYCPNTSIISKVNISSTFVYGLVSVIDLPASQIQFSGSTYTEVDYQSIYIDDDDEETEWYFTFNPGTSLLMNFTQILPDAGIYLQIDDEDVGYDIPSGSVGQYLFKPDTIKNDLPSHGYKISITTNTDIRYDVGFVSFSYNQTQYSNAQASINTTCPLGSPNCLWEIERGKDICFWTYNTYPTRLTSPSYTPYCTTIVQEGRDGMWMGIIFSISFVLITIILVVNFVVGYFVYRSGKSSYQLYPVNSNYKILDTEQ